MSLFDMPKISPQSNPLELCRLGEYRRAAILGLRAYKENALFDISLPFALFKIGRHSLSLAFTLELASREPHNLAQCAKVASQALQKLEPSIEQVSAAIKLTKSACLTPAQVALIGSKIRNQIVRHHFFDAYVAEHSFSENSIALAQAFSYKFAGDDTKSLSIVQELVANDHGNTDACNLAADILAANNYTYEARRFACLSLRHAPNNLYALEVLALSLYKESRWRAARKIFQIIHAQTGDDISLMNSLIALPPLALKANDLSNAIKGFDYLKELLRNPPNLLGIEKSLELCKLPLPSEFYLAYEGPYKIRENLEAARSFTRLSSQFLVNDIISHVGKCKVISDAAKTNSPAFSSKKIKIGFISRFFSNHSNLDAHYGLIKHLDRCAFSVYIIHRPGSVIDGRHEDVNVLADKIIYLNDEFGESCKTLVGLDLDILFFTDIGMSPLDSVLAMPHLARHQVTSWGLPHTTGVKEIDYYMRSSIFDDCESQDEYSEKLVDISGYIGYFSYDQSLLNKLSRDYFLLPPDRFLIGCLQSIHKIHPDFDSYLDEIAKIDDSILIVISPTEADTQMSRFIDRLKQSAPVAYSRLCILQRTCKADFYSLNHILDLNLDTIYYGAGVTFVETTWCGPPYVTQHSGLVKGSVVSGSYKYAGIDNPPVACNKQEYIDIVRFYFSNRDALQELRDEIQRKSEGRIYNNIEYIKNCELFFKRLADEPSE
jgi:hypothetical protein